MMTPTLRRFGRPAVACLVWTAVGTGCDSPTVSLTHRDLYPADAAAGLRTGGAVAPGVREDTPAAGRPAGTDAPPNSPARTAADEFDDFTVMRVNHETIKLSSVYQRIRPTVAALGPRPAQGDARRKWETDVYGMFAEALERRINEILEFDDLFKQLSGEAHGRVRLLVDQMVESDIKRIGSRDRWLEALKAEGRTEDEHRRLLLLHVLQSWVFREKVRSAIEVSPDEVQAEYERRKEAFERPAARRPTAAEEVFLKYREIKISKEVVEGSARALPDNPKPSPVQIRDHVAARLAAGADFAALAGEFSEYFPGRGGLAPIDELSEGSHTGRECNESLARLKPGEFTAKPVETGAAWHFFKLESRRRTSPEQRYKPKAEVAEEIRRALTEDKFHAQLRRYVADLRARANLSDPDPRVRELLIKFLVRLGDAE